MSQDKKSKKNGIEKLRKILDDIPLNELDSESEKNLITLKKRLNEPDKKIVFTNSDREDADPLKPKVLVHFRKEQKITITKQEIDKTTEIEVTKKTEQTINEDVFEVEKVKVKGPEFIEVKPIELPKEETIEFEEKTTLAEGELTEWEPIEKEVKETKKKPEKISEGGKICPKCGIKLEDVGKFCPKCGENLNSEVEKNNPTNNPEPIPNFISVEKQDEKASWEPVEVEKTVTEEKPVEELIVDDDQEMKIQTFKDLESIDDKTAIILYDSGYTTADTLTTTTVKDLSKIKGIRKKKAKEIIKEITPEVEEFEEKLVEPEPIPVGETAVVEVTKEQITPEEDLISVEEKVEPFKDMNSIDDETAIILYNAGYTSFDLLKETSYKELKKVNGLKRKTAKNIIEEIDEKIQEKSQVKPIAMGDTSKGQISKDQIKDEAIKYEEETGKSSPVELRTTTSEWTPIDEETFKPEEEKLELTEEELKEIRKKVETFNDIDCIDDETALLLYDNGYTSIDSLTIVTVKELAKIKGIKKKNAKEIKKEIDEKTQWKTPSTEEVEEKKPEEEFIESEEELLVDANLNEKQIAENKEKVKVFKEFESIDDETAILLYDNGYTTVDLIKDAKVKDFTKIKGIKKKKAKIIHEELVEKFQETPEEDAPIVKGTKEYFNEEDKIEEESDELDDKITNYEEPEPIDQEMFEEEEPVEDVPEIKIEEEPVENVFEGIPSINEKIYKLLIENEITTIALLNDLSIKNLTKIKGIRKKVAKKIKQEVKEQIFKEKESEVEKYEYEENPYIQEENEDEWESYEEGEKSKAKAKLDEGFQHGDYTLYEKEIKTKSGNKRLVRFFSKGEPENTKLIKLPKGYEVKENKKTGVPYLRKKK